MCELFAGGKIFEICRIHHTAAERRDPASPAPPGNPSTSSSVVVEAGGAARQRSASAAAIQVPPCSARFPNPTPPRTRALFLTPPEGTFSSSPLRK